MKFESVSNSAIESVDIDRAYEKALKYFDKVSPRVNPMDEEFIEKYGQSNVENDVKYVEEMEEKFASGDISKQKETSKLATIFEAVVSNEIYSSEWLGGDADTIISSRYDDIKNGVDIIVEKGDDNEKYHLALAVDVTFGADVKGKFDKIRREIDNGKLTEVKYFSHSGGDLKIGLENIPRLVIGADAGTVKELSELWISGDKKALAEHRIQVQILEEMALQLKTFKKYAESIGKTGVADKYDETLKIINRVISEKININNEGIGDDKVFNAIGNEMDVFGRRF